MVLGLVHRYAWIFKMQSSNNVNQSRFLQDLGPAKGVDDERITPSASKLCYMLQPLPLGHYCYGYIFQIILSNVTKLSKFPEKVENFALKVQTQKLRRI